MLGDRIREMREAKGLRQQDVASRFTPPIDPGLLSRWENGKASPQVRNLVELAKVLECQVGDFFVSAVCVELKAN